MSENSGQIIPMLAYEDGVAAMDWLRDVFGFVEKSRMLDDQDGLPTVSLRWEAALLCWLLPLQIIRALNIIVRSAKRPINGIRCRILLTAYWYWSTTLYNITSVQKNAAPQFSHTLK